MTRRTIASGAAVLAAATVPVSGALGAETPAAAVAKPMKMDDPMAGKMKRTGMKKGDVRKAAEQQDREMREMMEKEAKATRSSDTNK